MSTAVKTNAKPAASSSTKESLPIVASLGFLAGDIFKYLEKHGEASLNDLKTELNQTPAMLQMAVGWLAREGQIQITKQGAGYLIRLSR